MTKFEPKTVYVTYIASPPEKVWQALTSSEFTRKYFWDRNIEIEPKVGGAFVLRLPDGRVNVQRQGHRMRSAAQVIDHLEGSDGPRNSASCPNVWSPTRSSGRQARSVSP